MESKVVRHFYAIAFRESRSFESKVAAELERDDVLRRKIDEEFFCGWKLSGMSYIPKTSEMVLVFTK